MKKRIILILFFFTPLLSRGTDYYVAKTGSDSNSGSLNSPFRTIEHAVDVVRSGDDVYIRAGTYNERFTIFAYESSLIRRGTSAN